jgi:uncharacterized caspase-like protein
MLKAFSLILFSFFSLATVSQATAAEKRVALLIGNAAYSDISALRMPLNDVRAVAKILKGMGFEVILGTDATKQDLDQLTDRFRTAAKGADVGFFFYSGHGFQTNRVDQQHPVNQIVPVDFKVLDTDTELATLALDVVVDILRNVRVGLIFMDACRNDPKVAAASEKLANSTRAVTISRGLSAVREVPDTLAPFKRDKANRPTGLLIAYATGPGKVAFDGDKGPLSPFTTALVKHMSTAGLSIGDVMGRVSADVTFETQGEQTPWNVSSLTAGSYHLIARQLPPPPSNAPGKSPAPAPARPEPKAKVPFQLQ